MSSSLESTLIPRNAAIDAKIQNLLQRQTQGLTCDDHIPFLTNFAESSQVAINRMSRNNNEFLNIIKDMEQKGLFSENRVNREQRQPAADSLLLHRIPNALLAVVATFLSLTEQLLILGCVCRRLHRLVRSPAVCRIFDLQSVMHNAALPEQSAHGCYALWNQRRRRRRSSCLEADEPPLSRHTIGDGTLEYAAYFWLKWLLLPSTRSYLSSSLQDLRATACDVPSTMLYRVLSVYGCQITALDLSHSSTLTDDVLVNTVGHLTSPSTLQRLSLNFCSALTDAGLQGLCERLAGGSLAEINLCGLLQLSETSFHCVLSSFPRLTTLNARSTSLSGALCFGSTSRKCHLRTVLLSMCSNTVTDDSLLALWSSHGATLQEVVVDRCEKITDKGLRRALASSTSSLFASDVRVVSFVGCWQLGDASIVELMHKCSATLETLLLDKTKVTCRVLELCLTMPVLKEVSMVECRHVKFGLSSTKLKQEIRRLEKMSLFRLPTRKFLCL
eukprot:PhM_4_TR6881/c0_g1_i1/m.3198